MKHHFSIPLKLIVAIILACIDIAVGTSSLAEYSINFRDIPWLSSEKQVLQALKEQGVLADSTDLDHTRRDVIEEWEPFAGCEYANGVEISSLMHTVGYDRVPKTFYAFRGTYNPLEHEEEPICQVAGYGVNVVRIDFLPEVKEQSDGEKTYDTSNLLFVRAGYLFDNLSYGKDEEAYLELQEKLISLYGNPLEKNDVWKETIWHSVDGVGIYLRQSDGAVILNYAYINDESMVAELSEIQHALDDNAKKSTDGL